MALTDAGVHTEEAHDVGEWLNGSGDRVAVMWAGEAPALDPLRQVCGTHPDATVVALLPKETPATWRQALEVGATAAVAHDAELGEIVAVVLGAVEGRTVMPRDVAKSLVREAGPTQSAPAVTDCELRWLKALAAGATISELAETVAYSERALYRHLSDVYGRLGASNKSQALLAAFRCGLIR